MAIRLVVGLGNPGAQYEDTRHNAGALVVDALARELGASYWKSECGASVAHVRVSTAQSPEVALARPQTYMNESGGPVKRLMTSLSLAPDEVLVAHDELELASGEVRIKAGGGLGGHNGLRSIKQKLGTGDFLRLRIGIGRPPGRMAPADYVLAPLKKDAAEEFAATVDDAAQAALYAIENGLEQALGKYGK